MFFFRHHPQANSPCDSASPSLVRGFLAWLWHALQPWAAEEYQNEGRVLTHHLRKGILVRSCFSILLTLLSFGGLLRHVEHIQLQEHEYYLRQAKAICQRSSIETAHRGNILDLNGNSFASDVSTRDLYVEPKRFADKLDVATRILAKELDLDQQSLLKNFQKATTYEFRMKIAEKIPMTFIRENALTQIRGLNLVPIFDASGKPESFKVYFYPSRLSEDERKISCEKLLSCFQFTKGELEQNCKRTLERCREIPVQRNISRDMAETLLAKLRDAGITEGVRCLDSWRRDYPRGSELANMLGFTDNENRGVSGVEKLMDAYLRPVMGKRTYLHDSHGRPVEEGEIVVEEAIDGADVYLTIQEPIQRILEEELGVLWKEMCPDRAYAVMVDPSTGAIMGLAQYPQFDPNDRTTMEDPDLCQNHILLQCYDPGSVMKAISLTGVLAAGVATLDTVKDCEKGYWVYNKKGLRDSHRFEELTLSEVIQKSSNIGTAKFALDLGEERMYQHLSNFLFGKPTGLGFYPDGKDPVVFRQEAGGIFRELHQWDSLTLTRVPMGQGMTIPLLQIVQAWSALANNGIIMQPYLVDRVRYADGRMEYSVPRVKSQAVSAQAVAQMRKALVTVTEKGGTGTNAAVKGFHIAGKTGTAQMWIQPDKAKGIKGHYAEHQFLASFIGFAPAENPRFLLLVSAENPTKKYHTGSGVSAPAFKRIATRTLEYLQVAPEEELLQPPTKATAKR